MAVYSISYNLQGNDDKYLAVDKVVKECCVNDIWMHYIDNTWFIKSQMSADQIGTKLNSITKDEDAFIVAEITNNYAGWLPQEGFDFMYNSIFK